MGNPERPKILGMQDKKLSMRAQVYIRLMESAITHTMKLEGCQGDETSPIYSQQKEALATVRDEVRRFGFHVDNFNDVVKSRIQKLKDDERDETDWEHQAQLGDVPPVTVVNFGWRIQGKNANHNGQRG